MKKLIITSMLCILLVLWCTRISGDRRIQCEKAAAARELVKNPDPHVRFAALSCLAYLKDTASLDLFIEGLEDSLIITVEACGNFLCKNLPSKDEVDLTRLLSSPFPPTAFYGARLAGLMKDDTQIPRLMELLDASDQHLAREAMIALGRLNASQALSKMVEKMLDPASHNMIVRAGRGALIKMDAHPFTLKHLSHFRSLPPVTKRDKGMLLHIASDLAAQGKKEGFDALIEIMADPDHYYWLFRREAVKKLDELNYRPALTHLKKVAQASLSKSSFPIKETAFEVYQKLGGKEKLWQAPPPQAVQKDNSILITWPKDSRATAYYLYRDNIKDFALRAFDLTDTQFMDTLIRPGATYIYYVQSHAGKDRHSLFSPSCKITVAGDDTKEIADKKSNGQNRFLVKRIGTGKVKAFEQVGQRPGSKTLPTYHTDVVVGDLNNDGHLDFISHQRDLQKRRAFLLDGSYLWERPYYCFHSPSHNIKSVIGDLDEDGKNEVAVLEHENSRLFLRILDPLTGTVKNQRNISKDLNPANEYRDDIYLADLKGTGKLQTIVIQNNCYSAVELWAFDHELKPLWSYKTETASGHRLVFHDLDNDNKDEIVLGRDVVDHNGKMMFRAPDFVGQGHADGITVMDFDPARPGLEIAYAGCNQDNAYMMGADGKLLWNHVYGHAQWLAGGEFRPDIPGKEILVNFKSDNKIIWGFDCKGNLFEHNIQGMKVQRIDWDGNDANGDEIITTDGRVMESTTGRVIMQCKPGMLHRVIDIMGDGREEIVESDVENGTINIYGNTEHNPNPRPSKWKVAGFYRDYVNPFK
jgi:HEAT repeat protein